MEGSEVGRGFLEEFGDGGEDGGRVGFVGLDDGEVGLDGVFSDDEDGERDVAVEAVVSGSLAAVEGDEEGGSDVEGASGAFEVVFGVAGVFGEPDDGGA